MEEFGSKVSECSFGLLCLTSASITAISGLAYFLFF